MESTLEKWTRTFPQAPPTRLPLPGSPHGRNFRPACQDEIVA